MKPLALALPVAIVLLTCSAPPSQLRADELTPEQILAIQARLDELRDVLEGKTADRNRSASSVFMSASQDPKEAAELLENCTRIVNFEREGRDDSEFRDWQDRQRDLYKDDQYMQSLMLQLRWLAITCKATEVEDFSTLLPEILSYLDSLTNFTELPGNAALTGVDGTIFVRAYELERVMAKHKSWSMVPFDIPGIYENIILPYLRSEKPEQLMTAWDKRISQQTWLVGFIRAMQEDQLRGDRDEKRRIEDRQRREQASRTILRDHDEDDFELVTLPGLKWARLMDKYKYVDKVTAAQEILAFLNENVTNRKIMDWLDEFHQLLSEQLSPGSLSPQPDPAPAPAPAPTVTGTSSNSAPPPATGGAPPSEAETLGLD